MSVLGRIFTRVLGRIFTWVLGRVVLVRIFTQVFRGVLGRMYTQVLRRVLGRIFTWVCGWVLGRIFTWVHSPAPTASRDGLCFHHTCLPSCRQLTLTSHPTAATASCNLCHPCLPPRGQSALCVNVDVESYRPHRHARSSSSLSSSPPPVNVAH
jgi:hypothetical protein